MYIWRKRATNDWLKRQSDQLERRFGDRLAIIDRPGKSRALVEVCCDTRTEALQLQREFGGAIEKLGADWLSEYTTRTRVTPLRIGSRLVVSRTSDGPRTIVIPAEAAFGTGEHATTAMCLRMLERITRNRPTGWRLLDAGTGSGILAIAAARFGAKRVVAIDNDPMACSVARRNAKANGAKNIEFRTGDVLRQRFRGKFDIITANLYSEILIAALPGWTRLLANDGALILSGILRSQERAVVTALRQHKFAVQDTKRRGKWVAFVAARAGKNS
jgi:ribosomal protein L11 methyltransferase